MVSKPTLSRRHRSLGITQLQTALLIAVVGFAAAPALTQLGGGFELATIGSVTADEQRFFGASETTQTRTQTSNDGQSTPTLAYSRHAASGAIVRTVSKVADALSKVQNTSWSGLRPARLSEFDASWYRRPKLAPETERLRGLGNRPEAVHPEIAAQLKKIPEELLAERHGWKRGDDPSARLVFVDMGITPDEELARISVADGINARQNYSFHFEVEDSRRLPPWELEARIEEGREGQAFEDAIRGFADMVATDDYVSMERALDNIARSRKLTGTLRESAEGYIRPLNTQIDNIRQGLANMDGDRIMSARNDLRSNLERFVARGWLPEEDVVKLDLKNLLGDTQNSIDRRAEFLADLDRQEGIVARLASETQREVDALRDGVRAKELPESVRETAELSLDGKKVAETLGQQALLDVINANLVRSRLVFWNGDFESEFLRKTMRERLIPNSQRQGGPKWVSPDAQLEWDGRRVTGGQRSVYRLYERLAEPSFSLRDASRMYLYDTKGVEIDGVLGSLGLGVSNKGPKKTAYTLARVMKAMAPYLPDDYGAILTEQLLYRSVRRNIYNKILPSFKTQDELEALVRRDPGFGKILDKDLQDITIGSLDFEATSKYTPQATQVALRLNKGGKDVGEPLDFLIMPVKHADPENISKDPSSYRVIKIDDGAREKTVSERFPNGIGDDVVAGSPTFLEFWESTLKPELQKADLFEAYNAPFEARTFGNELFDLMVAAERKTSRVTPEGKLTPAEQLLPKALLRPALDAFPLFTKSSVGLVDVETGAAKGYRYKRGYGTHKLESAAALLNDVDSFNAHDAVYDVIETIAVRQRMIELGITGKTVREILEQQNGIRPPAKVWDNVRRKAVSLEEAIELVENAGGTRRTAWTLPDAD